MVGAILGLAAVSSSGYVVRAGDTLSHIAHSLDVSVAALADANGISDPNRIYVGQSLQVPGGALAGGGATYRVGAGDTLSHVAVRHGVSTQDLLDANGIADANRIYVGQVLRLPGGTAPAAAGGLSRAEAGDVIVRVSREWGWNPAFVKALAWQESGWQMDRTSSVGAVGIMQVLPGTRDFVSRELVGRSLDLHDPYDNVTAGVAFLDYLYDLTGGDAEMTLGGYYQGLRSIRHNGMYPSTERYIANVLALKQRF